MAQREGPNKEKRKERDIRQGGREGVRKEEGVRRKQEQVRARERTRELTD